MCRLYQRTILANEKPGPEPESDHFTNGLSDGSEAVFAGDVSQPVEVPSSQKLLLSVHDADLPLDTAVQEARGGSDILNGNYVSSDEMKVAPSTVMSPISEEPIQTSVTADVTIRNYETSPSSQQHVQSHPAAAASAIDSDNDTVTESSILMDAKQAKTASRETVSSAKDIAPFEASDKVALNEKHAEVFAEAVTAVSVISRGGAEISNVHDGALENGSIDASSVPINNTDKPAFSAEEIKVIPVSDLGSQFVDLDSKDSIQKLSSEISSQQETAAEDLAKKFPDIVCGEDSKEYIESSHLADTVTATEHVTTVSTEHDISYEIMREVVTGDDHSVLKTYDGDHEDVGVDGVGTQPSSALAEDALLHSDGQDSGLGKSIRKVSEGDDDRTVPQQGVADMVPSSEPCGDVGISDDQEKTKQTTVMAETDFCDKIESDLNRTADKVDSFTILPEYDHYNNDAEDEDDGHHDKRDSADVDTDDDHATSLQVAPRSVKMQETAKGRQPGSKTSAVVCARPARGTDTKTSKDLLLADAVTEVRFGDDSTKEQDDVSKHPIVMDDGESAVRDSVDEKLLTSKCAADDEQTVLVDLPDTASDQHPSVSCKAPLADVIQDAVGKGVDVVQQSVELGKSITATTVEDSQPIIPRAEEDLPKEQMLFNNTASCQPDFQGSPTDQTESSRKEPQLQDGRHSDAELAVQRSWQLQQQQVDIDDQNYSSHEFPPETGATGGDRGPPRDRAGDAGGFSMSKAVKTGLMAVAVGPYLARVAIKDALRSDTHPSSNVPQSHIQKDQRPTEMARTVPEERQKKPDENRDGASQAFTPDLPSQLEKDTVQPVDSTEDHHGEAFDVASDLTQSVNTDTVAVDSLLRQHSDTSQANFQQPLLEPTSAAAGYQRPALSEVYDDRLAQSEVEPSLLTVASTQPLEVTTLSAIPTAVSTQPSISTVKSEPAQLSTHVTPSTVPSAERTTSFQPVTETADVVAPTISSALPSATAPLTSTFMQFNVSISAIDSTKQAMPTAQASLSTVVSTTLSAYTTETALSQSRPPIATTQSVPRPVLSSETSKFSLLSEPSATTTTSTSVSTTSAAPPCQPLTVTTQDIMSPVPVTRTFVGKMPSTVTDTELITSPAQSTLPVVTSTAAFALRVDSGLSTVTCSRPSVLPPTELTGETVFSTTSTQYSFDTAQEPLTESVPQPIPVASSQTYVSAGAALSSPDSLQSISDAVSTATTTSSTSLLTMSEQASAIILPVSTQESKVAIPVDAFSDQRQITAHLKPTIHEEHTEDELAADRMSSLQDTESWELEQAEVDDYATHLKHVQYKQPVTSDDERTSAAFFERDEVGSEMQSSWGQCSQSEKQSHDSGLSSIVGSVKTAVQVGLLGVVGAPVLAGMAVRDALKSKSQQRQDAGSGQGVSLDDVTISPHEFAQEDSDYRQHRVRPEETDIEPNVMQSVTCSDQPFGSAFVVSRDADRDNKDTDEPVLFQIEMQPKVAVDSRHIGDDKWKGFASDRDVRDEAEIAAHQRDITDEMQNDFDRDVTSGPGLSLSEALLSPLYDQQHNCFIDPATGRRISLASAVHHGLIDGHNKVIADLNAEEVISVLEALSRGIIDSETGMVSVDGESCVPLNEALASGLIMDDVDIDLLEMVPSIGAVNGHTWNDITDSARVLPKSEKSTQRESARQPLRRPLKLVQMLDLGLYNPESGEFQDPQSSNLLSLADTIRYHLLDKDSVVINDPQSEEVLSLEESIRGGLVSGSTSLVHDTSTSENVSLTEALRRGILVPRPMSIATAINIGLYDKANGMFFDPTNGLYFALEEAVESGLIDPHSLVIDPATGKTMAVAVALACGVLDARHGNVVNIHTGEVIPLKQMAVGSQAVTGTATVGVSNQIAAASADVEGGVKPTIGPEVYGISERSAEVLVTADDGIRTKDTWKDGTEHDTLKTVKTAAVTDVTNEPSDVLSGDKELPDHLQKDADHGPCYADMLADDELRHSIIASTGEVAEKSQKAIPERAKAEVSDEHIITEAREARLTDDSSESHVSDESCGAPVCDESLKSPVRDDALQDIKTDEATRPACDSSLPASVSTSMTDQSVDKLSASADSGLPTSSPVSTTTSLILSDEFQSTPMARAADSSEPASVVDGVSNTIALQHVWSSPEPTAASEVSLRADDSAGIARDVELQQIAVAGPGPGRMRDVDSISTDITRAENAEAAHSIVELDHLTHVEFTPAQDRGIGQPLDIVGRHDIEELTEMKHIEVELVSSDVLRTDDGKKLDSSRDFMLVEVGTKCKDTKHIAELQQPSDIIQFEVNSFPIDYGKKDDAIRVDESKDDGNKDAIEKGDMQIGTAANVVEPEAGMHGIGSGVCTTGELVKKNVARKDEVEREDISDHDLKIVGLKEGVPEKLDDQKGAKSVVKLRNIVPVTVESLPTDEMKGDELRKRDSKGDDFVMKSTEKNEVQKVFATEKPLATDDAKKGEMQKDELGDDSMSQNYLDTAAAPRKDDATEFQRDVQELSSVVHVSAQPATSISVKEGGLTEGIVKRPDAATEERRKDKTTEVTESHSDVQRLSSVVKFEVEMLPSDIQENDDLMEDDVKRMAVVDNGTAKYAVDRDDVQQQHLDSTKDEATSLYDDKVDEDISKKDGATSSGISKDDTENEISKKQDEQIAFTIVRSREDVQLLTNIVQVEVKPFSEDVGKKDSMPRGADMSKDDEKKDRTEKELAGVLKSQGKPAAGSEEAIKEDITVVDQKLPDVSETVTQLERHLVTDMDRQVPVVAGQEPQQTQPEKLVVGGSDELIEEKVSTAEHDKDESAGESDDAEQRKKDVAAENNVPLTTSAVVRIAFFALQFY